MLHHWPEIQSNTVFYVIAVAVVPNMYLYVHMCFSQCYPGWCRVLPVIRQSFRVFGNKGHWNERHGVEGHLISQNM